jgi:hypothetical protein
MKHGTSLCCAVALLAALSSWGAANTPPEALPRFSEIETRAILAHGPWRK